VHPKNTDNLQQVSTSKDWLLVSYAPQTLLITWDMYQ